jgi:hypothetical protein
VPITPNTAAKAISLNTPLRWGEQKDEVLKKPLKWNDGSQISDILPNTDKTTYESIPTDIDIRSPIQNLSIYQKNIEWKRKIDEKNQNIKKQLDEHRNTQYTFQPNLIPGKKIILKSKALNSNNEWNKQMDDKR